MDGEKRKFMSFEVAGIKNPGRVYLNPSPAELVELAIRRNEALLSDVGALVAETGKLTGRSPKDRFFVRHGRSAEKIDWGARNQPFDLEKFDALYERVQKHLEGKELFVIDGYIGADPQYRIKLRVV
ncbi:MAG: phosphoenolpyruvate carboxykinase (ATP), partial [Actinomycetota bacterium]